ncbi:hypothetical protein ACM5ME_20545 [Bacillus subtilis]|uniref:hypothetical protein n=1 Tax=Bacillus subtilis group TaxID=653685 RepID=UPI0005ED841B|nr:hypothetical protein [Bacillus amyloliquefaciens]MCY8256408.1 hypothetical protein [Bacillus spizizenii]
MGLLEILTIIFVALKLFGVISWSWWLVLLPEIIAVGLYVLWFAFVGSLFVGTVKQLFKR